MKRRSFLKNSVATGALLSVNACKPDNKDNSPGKILTDDFELNEITISQLQKSFDDGSLTCEKAVQMYLDRIDAIDKNGPSLNSVIELNPEALEIARKLDSDLKEGNKKGPLHGIPIMLKDNIDIAGKMMTTAGSLALNGHYASKNSTVAQKLIDAGAIIIGKTNLSEWANFRSLRSSSGWSGRGGQTRNPYITDRNPCGSSSGSGVAASANLCAGTIGTETNGSIVCPSSINGIVGIKPTVGLVSRTGIVPISHSQDTAGPMCRTVEDAAIMLGALTGVDQSDAYTQKSEGKAYTDYTQFLDKNSLSNKKIGIATHYTGFHSEVDKLLEKAKDDLRHLGSEVIEIKPEDLNNRMDQDAYNVLLYEFKHDLNAYLRNCPSSVKYRTLEDLIEFNKQNADEEMPFFDQEIFIASQEMGDLNADDYKNALENVLTANGPEGIDRVLDNYELDVIIAPTGAPSWPIDVINGDHYIGGSSSPAARSGYPNITVPMGFVHGLPVGLSFFAEAFSEPKLIGLTYAFEQYTKHRKPPEFIPTFDFTTKSQ
jgi:amidase